MLLASLYRNAGRWNDAKAVMVELLASNPNEPQLAATYSEWLLERNELREAAVWLRKLDPQSYDALRLGSIIQVRQGKSKEVATRLMGLVPKNPSAADVDQIMGIASQCETLAQYNPSFYALAEQLWKRAVKLRPNDVVTLIGFYTRYPRGEKLDLAFELCERKLAESLKSQDPDLGLLYINLGIQALQIHQKDLPADSPYAAHVEKWIAAARKANVDELSLLSQEIQFLITRGNFKRLEAAYRSFLSRTDTSELDKAQMRNNLAYLLAISGRGTEALEVIGDAIEQLGPRGALLDTRAMAYLSNGQVEQAIQDLRSVIASGDVTPGIYFHLALAEQKNGNTAEAVNAFRQGQAIGLSEESVESMEVPIYQKLLKELEPELNKQESELELSAT